MYILYFHYNGKKEVTSGLNWQVGEGFDHKQFAIDGPGDERVTSVQVAIEKRVDWSTARHTTGPVPLYYEVWIILFFWICVVDNHRSPPTSGDTYKHDARPSVGLQKKTSHYKK